MLDVRSYDFFTFCTCKFLKLSLKTKENGYTWTKTFWNQQFLNYTFSNETEQKHSSGGSRF